ncbi:Hcp family type VI secretion system effector [Methylocella sp.]|uniref:Hcp family type VI secretion system effector n=1 Tax=Methylocella sp. TaxID=1978226 RepID=UPI0037849112
MSGDIFLKLEGIEGESEDSKHKNEMQVETVSWGVSNATSFSQGGGGGVGKAHLQDIHLTKKVDKGSPKLFLACASGEHVKSATLTFRKSGKEQQEYLIVKLSDVMISSISFQDHAAGGDLAHESISLAYAKIETEYKPQKSDGTLAGGIQSGWNVKENKKV